MATQDSDSADRQAREIEAKRHSKDAQKQKQRGRDRELHQCRLPGNSNVTFHGRREERVRKRDRMRGGQGHTARIERREKAVRLDLANQLSILFSTLDKVPYC